MKTHDTPHRNLPGAFQRRAREILFFSALAIPALIAMSPVASAAEQRSQATAQTARVAVEGYQLQRKDFRFGSFSGWLNRKGEWHIEGPVGHKGLLCGTYEVGLRFGVGKPDCTDVQWVSDDRFVTSQSQCNMAEMQHAGNDIDEGLAEQFDAITCAERVVRCSGNCK